MANVQKIGSGRSAKYAVKYRTLGGQARTKHFDRKADADAFADKVETDKRRGTFTDPARGRMRFGAWADEWLAMPHATRPSTRARDESYLRTNVRPFFDGWRLAEIRTGDVQSWLHSLSERGLAPATVHKAHQILAKVLDAAVRDDRIAGNPARGVVLPSIPDEEARFLDPGELLALEDAMPEHTRLIVPFLADTGLRIGEAAALRWRDVDTWAGKVTVARVLVEVRGTVTLGPPKTAAGRRVVPTLTREVAARLEAIRSTPDAHVFSGPSGGPLRPSLFRSRIWRPSVASAGLSEPLPTPHALRHTAIAHWIAAGVEPYKLAKWAGHRSVATIYRVYGHLLDDDATAEREALSAIRAAATAAYDARGTVLPMRVSATDGGATGARSTAALQP